MVVKFEHSEQTFFVEKQISNYHSIEPWNIFYILNQRKSIQLLILVLRFIGIPNKNCTISCIIITTDYLYKQI